jgi:hypothetical protein
LKKHWQSKRVDKDIVRLHHTSRRRLSSDILSAARRGYVTAETNLGAVLGDVTMHRLRLRESLQHHPLRDSDKPLKSQPIACRMLDIMTTESLHT